MSSKADTVSGHHEERQEEEEDPHTMRYTYILYALRITKKIGFRSEVLLT